MHQWYKIQAEKSSHQRTLGQNCQKCQKLITTSPGPIFTHDMSFYRFLGSRNPFLNSKVSQCTCIVLYCSVLYSKTQFISIFGWLQACHMSFCRFLGSRNPFSNPKSSFCSCTVLYCTPLYCKVLFTMYLTSYEHDICLFPGLQGQQIHF